MDDRGLRHSDAHALLPASVTVLERGWLSSNTVVLDEGQRISVVDTGYADHAAQTLALVQRAARGRPLAHIWNTHLHSDHIGGNALLAQTTGARIFIPPGHAQAVADWDEDALTFKATAQHCPRFTPAGVLQPGSTVPGGDLDWQVLAAPGHDPHMILLWAERVGVLISADALWADGFGAIFPRSDGGFAFEEQAAALALISACAPRVVIPGHGAPFADVQGALAKARSRLAALSEAPQRNARHVLKVLVKFWLLQVRETTRAQLYAHFSGAQFVSMLSQHYFHGERDARLLDDAVDALCVAGAAQCTQDRIANIDR